MLANGLGVDKNETEAAMWYRKAADQGDKTAQTFLGWMFNNGIGVDKNECEAVKWYRKASDQGSVDAERLLASVPIGNTNCAAKQ